MDRATVEKVTLTAIWWIWSLALFFGLIFVSLQQGIFGDDVQKVWQWFLPNVLPTMTLVGAASYAAPPPAQNASPPLIVFLFAVLISVLYLLVLTASVLVATIYEAKPLEFMTESSLWLAPLQGFATSTLAFYFVKK